MIRNRMDGQDVPMKVEAGQLVLDVAQLRLEQNRCPDCPTQLRWTRKRGWWACPCCLRAWRKRPDGRFYEQQQFQLNQSDCRHVGDSMAGPEANAPAGH